MSRRPQHSAPPDKKGQARLSDPSLPRRGGSPAASDSGASPPAGHGSPPRSTSPPPARGSRSGYKRPVQSPDAETVMLPSYKKADADAADQPVPAAAADSPVLTEEEPDPSTRVLLIPRGKHGPARVSESSSRRKWVSRAVLAAILCVQAALSLRMHNTAFEDEALYLYSGHLEIAHWLHGAALQGNYATYFSGAPVLYPVLGAAADNVGGLAAARAVSLLAMLATTGLLYSLTRRLFNERVGLCAAAIFRSPNPPSTSATWPPMMPRRSACSRWAPGSWCAPRRSAGRCTCWPPRSWRSRWPASTPRCFSCPRSWRSPPWPRGRTGAAWR